MNENKNFIFSLWIELLEVASANSLSEEVLQGCSFTFIIFFNTLYFLNFFVFLFLFSLFHLFKHAKLL